MSTTTRSTKNSVPATRTSGVVWMRNQMHSYASGTLPERHADALTEGLPGWNSQPLFNNGPMFKLRIGAIQNAWRLAGWYRT
jgi:hypothetical protein